MRLALLEAFCALEADLTAVLAPSAPKMFGQKIECLSVDQLGGVDPKSLVAARNLVAHAQIVSVSRAGAPVSVWQVPHAERQLNARIMSREELAEWCAGVSEDIRRVRKAVLSPVKPGT